MGMLSFTVKEIKFGSNSREISDYNVIRCFLFQRVRFTSSFTSLLNCNDKDVLFIIQQSKMLCNKVVLIGTCFQRFPILKTVLKNSLVFFSSFPM